jgi:hypothetical protein
MTTRFNYYFMDINGLWKEYLQEIARDGFENSSSMARMIYSCETGNGIDQHVSEDLKAVSAELAELREIKQAAWNFVNADGRQNPPEKYETLKRLVNGE